MRWSQSQKTPDDGSLRFVAIRADSWMAREGSGAPTGGSDAGDLGALKLHLDRREDEGENHREVLGKR